MDDGKDETKNFGTLMSNLSALKNSGRLRMYTNPKAKNKKRHKMDLSVLNAC